MTAVRGYADHLSDRPAGKEHDLARRIVTNADSLIDPAEIARDLERLPSTAGRPNDGILAKSSQPSQLTFVTSLLTYLLMSRSLAQHVVAIELQEAALCELGENAIVHVAMRRPSNSVSSPNRNRTSGSSLKSKTMNRRCLRRNEIFRR